MRKSLITAAGVLALLTGLACGAGDDPDGDGAEVVDPGNENTSPDDSGGNGDGGAEGTRENPLPPGVTFAVGEYEVQLGKTDTNANDVIAAENEFNEPPADGRRFVMVKATVTYTGDASGTPWLDLSFSFYGSDGNTFGSAMDDYCPLIPNPLEDLNEMFPDASATGNVCVSVPEGQIKQGAWIVEELIALDTDRTFVALK